MKRIFTAVAAIIVTLSVLAQAPQKISYQAVIRNSANNLVTSHAVGMRVSIIQGSATGTEVYKEIYNPNPQTNANGLLTIEIGSGIPLTGTFATINWANGPYFIKTETDPTGGTNYTITGTSQLLSVPYALYAKTAETITGGITETDTATGQMLYWNGTAWVNVAPGTTGQVLTLINGVPTWTSTSAGTTDVYNPTTGKFWMDRNLGATQVATSSTDANSYGDLYQWGRGADGHQLRTSGTTTTLSSSNSPGHGNFILTSSSPSDWRSPQNENLWQGVSGINNPCPSGYRLPTEAEWNAERLSWSSNNAAGAFTSPLKLPVAGFRFVAQGEFGYVGSIGYYWSSTVGGTSSRYLRFNSNNAPLMDTFIRANGASVRCIKE
jgi:uncharacterized protein (TIGR02145 family)